jgi:hypothetical protein
MTAAGEHARQLTTFPGLDESPDWHAIPAPKTERRCGDAVRTEPGAHDRPELRRGAERSKSPPAHGGHGSGDRLPGGGGLSCLSATALALGLRRGVARGHDPRRAGRGLLEPAVTAV